MRRAAIELDFQPFPVSSWPAENITENHIFDVLEFLHEFVSKPGEWRKTRDDTGWESFGYDGFDIETGQNEYRGLVNSFLARYRDGYEMDEKGSILSMGGRGMQSIIQADIPILGDRNIDLKLRDAIAKWRNRQLNIKERREAIREMADVFEWLQKSKRLEKALSKKDESDLFHIANEFGIRHHNPKQKTDYDLIFGILGYFISIWRPFTL